MEGLLQELGQGRVAVSWERHANPREVKNVWWLGTLVLVGQAAPRYRSLGGRDFVPDLTEASVLQPDLARLLPGLHHLFPRSVLVMFCDSFPMSQVLTSNSLHSGPCCLHLPQQEASLPLGGHCPRWTLESSFRVGPIDRWPVVWCCPKLMRSQ